MPRLTRIEYVTSACTHIEAAHMTTDFDERSRLLNSAASALDAARETHLAALLREIQAGRAYISLLPTVANGLRRNS